jgi:hypothetical protein
MHLRIAEGLAMKTKEIAARLRVVAATLPFDPGEPRVPLRYEYAVSESAAFEAAGARYDEEMACRPTPTVVLCLGAFKVICLPYRDAVERVAAKYERGFRMPAGSGKARLGSLRRPKDADVTLAALLAECGETIREECAA